MIQDTAVTIITPTLNSVAFVRDLLACIEHQRYPYLEHIVVDGKSTDGTQDILLRADPSRHTVFIREDRSMYEAINFGIERARGEIIACLNADDLYFPNTVEYIVEFFRRHPEVEIAYGDQLTLYTQSDSFDPTVMTKEYSEPWGKVLVYISQPSVFIRRQVFEKVGLFNADLKAAGDFEFWIRAYRHGVKFKKFKQTASIVRMHANNLSSSATWNREHELLKDHYLPPDWRRGCAAHYRWLQRKFKINRFTVPFAIDLPRAYAQLDRKRYFRFLFDRRVPPSPILTVDLPYFRYQAFHALNLKR